jgi:PPOX class probable F420-dependent enzyme
MAERDKIEAFLAEPRNAIVIGLRGDGRPHATPNWFLWDGARFYVSTTRSRVKYSMFKRDPRAQLVIDDSSGFRAVILDAKVEILEDLPAELHHFRAIRAKHGVDVPSDEEQLASLVEEGRVLLAFTPAAAPDKWTAWGLG